MTHALRILQLEHRNLAKLLDLMDTQIYELDEGNVPERSILRAIAEYLSGYPDEVHHPKEDLILRKLQNRDPATGEKLIRILDEHEEVRVLTADFSAAIGDSASASNAPPERIREVMDKLVRCYRRHMEMEETHFFPKANEILSETDWAEVNFAVSEQEDPLFDEAVEKYQDLREDIFRLKDTTDAHSLAEIRLRQEFDVLAGLNGVAGFNELMKESGVDAKLGRSERGGYQLVSGNEITLEIPDCSENRAAWCAYFFLKGKNPGADYCGR